ncbi:hypothetical protein MMC25_000892 [Agyrium rufum]|nr:hypothetical protein [Agyrium rufum]
MLFTSLLLATFIGFPVALVSAQAVCNGHAELCDRAYPDSTVVGAHDSAFVGTLPTDNQQLSVTDQLNAGIRFLQAQTHNDPFGTLSICHTSCYELDTGPLESYLATVKRWLDGNPNEVLTMLLVNGDGLPASNFDAAFKASGINTYAFVPSSSPGMLGIDDWPTLGQMISAGTRLVVFLDSGASPSSIPYLLDEFSYFFETPYDTTDPSFPECTLDRSSGSSPDGKMYIVNHFLDINLLGILIPDNAVDPTTNAATGTGSIGSQVDICKGLYGGRNPKGILVDSFNVGDVFTAQDALDRV